MTRAVQTGKVMIEFEKAVFQEKPDLAVVVGDVDSTLATALTAVKLQIPGAHEEIIGVLTDHCSRLPFCPIETAIDNFMKKGISE